MGSILQGPHGSSDDLSTEANLPRLEEGLGIGGSILKPIISHLEWNSCMDTPSMYNIQHRCSPYLTTEDCPRRFSMFFDRKVTCYCSLRIAS